LTSAAVVASAIAVGVIGVHMLELSGRPQWLGVALLSGAVGTLLLSLMDWAKQRRNGR